MARAARPGSRRAAAGAFGAGGGHVPARGRRRGRRGGDPWRTRHSVRLDACGASRGADLGEYPAAVGGACSWGSWGGGLPAGNTADRLYGSSAPDFYYRFAIYALPAASLTLWTSGPYRAG